MKTNESTKEKKLDFSIPMRSIYSTLILILILGFTFLNVKFYLIPGFKEIFSLKNETTSLYHLGLFYIPIISYLLISLSVIFTVRIFKNLKNYKQEGLIFQLISGLIGGIIIGLALMIVLQEGLLLLFTAGLFLGLITGLARGFNEE